MASQSTLRRITCIVVRRTRESSSCDKLHMRCMTPKKTIGSLAVTQNLVQQNASRGRSWQLELSAWATNTAVWHATSLARGRHWQALFAVAWFRCSGTPWCECATSLPNRLVALSGQAYYSLFAHRLGGNNEFGKCARATKNYVLSDILCVVIWVALCDWVTSCDVNFW